jgi:Flp pilus assembly protein TadG
VGHNLDYQDKLDANGLAMSALRGLGFRACERASTAVEVGLVLPALAALVVGGLYTGLVVYSAAGLHHAVEQAARCYSVNVGQCGSVSAAQTYAQSEYYGVNSPTFTASTQSCGHQVAATVTVEIFAVVADLSVPLSATACFP